jgi:hypothetical protein
MELDDYVVDRVAMPNAYQSERSCYKRAAYTMQRWIGMKLTRSDARGRVLKKLLIPVACIQLH